MSADSRTSPLRQTLAGLLCAIALYLLAWNEVAALQGASLWSWLQASVPELPDLPGSLTLVRVSASLLVVAGSFLCLAGMGNTLGLISLFGGRIAFSARLTGALLGVLLALAAAVVGQVAGQAQLATLMVTPLASVLLLVLWRSRRGRAPGLLRPGSASAAPLMLDLPDLYNDSSPARRAEPRLPAAPAPVDRSKPATFTARAPRAGDGNPDLAPLDFDGARGFANKARATADYIHELGLPPLEFTPSSPARPAAPVPAPPPAARSAKAPSPPALAPRDAGPQSRLELPPLEFPAPTASQRPEPAKSTSLPIAPTLSLESLDFSPPPTAPVRRTPVSTAPLADELAQWSPRPATIPAPAHSAARPATASPALSPAPTPAAPAASTPTPRLPVVPVDDDPPLAAQAFTLDTVAPRERGPRRALLDEEPELLNQLGNLAKVVTPPSAPVPAVTPPMVASTPGLRSSIPAEPQRIKLADKGVFSIYKLVDRGDLIGYALTERGVTVTVGSQDEVKQSLRQRWPG